MGKESKFASNLSMIASLYIAFAVAAATSCLPRLICSKSQKTLTHAKKSARSAVHATAAASVLLTTAMPQMATASPNLSTGLRHHPHHWTAPNVDADGVPFSVINDIHITESSAGFNMVKAQKIIDQLSYTVNTECGLKVREWFDAGGVKIRRGKSSGLDYAKYYGAAFEQMPNATKVSSGPSGYQFHARDVLKASEVLLGPGYHPTAVVMYKKKDPKDPGHVFVVLPNGKTAGGFMQTWTRSETGMADPSAYRWEAFSLNMKVNWGKAASAQSISCKHHSYHARWHHHHRPHRSETVTFASTTMSVSLATHG